MATDNNNSELEREAGLASPPNFDRENGADFDPQAGPDGVRDRGHDLNSSLTGEGSDARQGARNPSVEVDEGGADREVVRTMPGCILAPPG